MGDRSERVLAALVRRMGKACDRTEARKGGVFVQSIDWHGLMEIAEEARALAVAINLEKAGG